MLRKATVALHGNTVPYKDVTSGPENARLVRKKDDSRLGLFVLSLFDLLLHTLLSKALSHGNVLNFRALRQHEGRRKCPTGKGKTARVCEGLQGL